MIDIITEYIIKKQEMIKAGLNPQVLKLSARNLPPEILNFAIKKQSGDIKKLDKLHLLVCESIIEYDSYIEYHINKGGRLKKKYDDNIQLMNDKLLYALYDEYRLRDVPFFSFKDKHIYKYISYEDGYKGFYKRDGKSIIKPVPYKKWL
jgi:hypothetical protein